MCHAALLKSQLKKRHSPGGTVRTEAGSGAEKLEGTRASGGRPACGLGGSPEGGPDIDTDAIGARAGGMASTVTATMCALELWRAGRTGESAGSVARRRSSGEAAAVRVLP